MYHLRMGAELMRLWQNLPQLTIAAMEGYVVGGGLSLCVACDLRVAANDAIVYVPEVHLGSNYGWGTVPRLVDVIGAPRTKRLVLLAEKLSAQEVAGWGLIDYLTSNDEAFSRALSLAQEVAGRGRLPVQITKRAVNAQANLLVDVLGAGEAEQIVLSMIEKEQKNV